MGCHEGLPLAHGASNETYAMVMELLLGLEGQRHCLVMDNYFDLSSFFGTWLKKEYTLQLLGSFNSSINFVFLFFVNIDHF